MLVAPPIANDTGRAVTLALIAAAATLYVFTYLYRSTVRSITTRILSGNLALPRPTKAVRPSVVDLPSRVMRHILTAVSAKPPSAAPGAATSSSMELGTMARKFTVWEDGRRAR